MRKSLHGIEIFLQKTDELLNELVIEAVRHGIPKAHIESIYDVRHKTIPLIKKSMERKNK
jgi:hypothetical protein